MKTFKKTIYVLATLLAVNFATQAQDFNPEAMVQRQMDRLENELKLTKEQSKKIWPMLSENVEKMMELRQSGLGMDQMREAMQKNGQAMMENMKSILTPEQLEKYKERQARMRQGGGGFGQRPQN